MKSKIKRDDYMMKCQCIAPPLESFRIGHKYLMIVDAFNGNLISRCAMTDSIKEKLVQIKKDYKPNDVRRVLAIDNIIRKAMTT